MEDVSKLDLIDNGIEMLEERLEELKNERNSVEFELNFYLNFIYEDEYGQ